jgi:hypothetical protein
MEGRGLANEPTMMVFDYNMANVAIFDQKEWVSTWGLCILVIALTSSLLAFFDQEQEFSTVAPDNNDPPPTFQEMSVPADSRLSGLAALVSTFGVQAPVRRPSRYPENTSRQAAGRRGAGPSSIRGNGLAKNLAISWDSRCAMKTSTCSS